MAKMIPSLTDDELKLHRPEIEADAYRALRDRTPADWLVFFCLRLVKQPQGGSPQHGELDFVVFAPEYGLAVVELKGGVVEIDPVTGIWTSMDTKGRRHTMDDPLDQALSGLKALTGTVRRELGLSKGDPHYLLTATGLWFPDLPDARPLVGPSRPPATLGDANALIDPEAWIRGVFQFWAQNNGDWRPFGLAGMAVAERLFADKIVVARPLAQVLAAEHERQVELTKQQAQVLRSLRYHPRARVSGAAGTGKTLLALEQARAFAAQGLRTLFVCYNRALSDFLARDCRGVQGLDAFTFNMLCTRRFGAVKKDRGLDLLDLARKERGVHATDEVLLPYALARSTEEHPFRYQAMVVDEGQDFGAAAFKSLQMLLESRKTSPWLVFYDPNQAIYRALGSIPIPKPRFVLSQNCRNTSHIHSTAYAFFRGDDAADASDVAGEPVTLLAASDLAAQAELIRQRVGDLLSRQALDPGDVAVLVAGDPKEPFYQALNASGPPDSGKWSFEKHWEKGGVVVDTVRRFKGLEGVVVILWGVEYVPAEKARELLYVALSRARSRVWIVGDAQRVQAVLRASAVSLSGLVSLL